jgi:hypothetical protein
MYQQVLKKSMEILQPLTARMGEAEDRLYELAAAGKTTTKEYKDWVKNLAVH